MDNYGEANEGNNMDQTERLLEKLTNAPGPTGFEGPVRAIMRQELGSISDTIETDGLGSLIAQLRGSSDTPKIMLAAHMDEVGLMVKLITPEGYLKFQTLGGWLDHALINQRWSVLTSEGIIPGVSGLKSAHIVSPEARTQLIRREQIFIDIGATSRQDAESRLGVRPGDPIVPQSVFTPLSGSKFYLGKAWDDRIGLAVIIRVLQNLKRHSSPNTVFAVSTVQEEVGLRGAHTSSFQVEPDIGINLESGVAGDYPSASADEAQEELGKGPAIFLHDSSMIPNLKLRDFVMGIAKKNKISLQFNVLSGYGQDGAEIQRSYRGVPSINIAIPTRYLHTHTGVISRNDFDETVKLVTKVVLQLNDHTVEELQRFD